MTIKELKEFYNLYYNSTYPVKPGDMERLIYLKDKFYTVVLNDLNLAFLHSTITSTALYNKVYDFVENKRIADALDE